MKIEWTSTTPAADKVTLGDDAVRHAIEIESLGGTALEQVTPIFRAPAAQRLARLNISGDFTFTAAKTHASHDAAAAYFLTEYQRLGQVGKLELTFTAGKFIFAGVNLLGVTRAQIVGVRWWIRYHFGVTTITNE